MKCLKDTVFLIQSHALSVAYSTYTQARAAAIYEYS